MNVIVISLVQIQVGQHYSYTSDSQVGCLFGQVQEEILGQSAEDSGCLSTRRDEHHQNQNHILNCFEPSQSLLRLQHQKYNQQIVAETKVLVRYLQKEPDLIDLKIYKILITKLSLLEAMPRHDSIVETAE